MPASEQTTTNSSQQRFTTVASVYLLLMRDNQVLLSRRANTGYEDGNYGLVSGHVEANEPLTQAMAREAAEEVGVIIASENLDVALTMHRYAPSSNPPERLDFSMRTTTWQNEPQNMEPDKCSDLAWFDLQNLPSNVIPYIKHALNEVAQGKTFCEFGWHSRQ